MKKRKSLPLISIFFATVILLSACSSKKDPTAEQWLLDQYENTRVLTLYAQNLDAIVCSYTTGICTQEEYLKDIAAMKKEYDRMLQIKEKIEKPIRVGTHTEETKIAEEGYQGIWSDLEQLTDSLLNDPQLLSVNELIYFYMAYGNSIRENADNYYAGYLMAGGIGDPLFSSEEEYESEQVVTEGGENNAG